MNEQNALCPRCHKKFECLPDAIENCHCSTIVLQEEEQHYITSKYKGCLCNKCLKELKKEYSINNK